MPWIETHNLKPGIHPLAHQIYNGLDACVTYEVHEALQGLSNASSLTYSFERGLQAPVLEMMLRGFRVDEYERQQGIKDLKALLLRLDGEYDPSGKKLIQSGILQRFAYAVWGKPLNPRSPKQLIEFFYGAMKLPEVWSSKKGVKKLSTDREALEKLQVYFHAAPIIACILAIRDLAKQLSVLETEVDSDGRMRTSYNIAGTETGRFSSSSSAWGTGTNLQNLKRDDDIGQGKLSLRKIFIADDGWKLCGIDLEQAESREVGWLCGTLFGDWSYLDACYSGDLHTLVCQYTWPKLAWSDDPKANRKIADTLFYRNYSYRDMAKKLGHGSNYMGQPFTMARHAKIPTKLAEEFQAKYFSMFPGIPKWHRWVAEQLQTTQKLTTIFGRTRHFFGRPNDDTTLREAIAFGPQSATADRMNLGLWKLWYHLGTRIRLTAQVHDAVYFQMCEDDDHAEIITKALDLINIPVSLGERKLIVPGEAKLGWNWGTYHEKFNPNGLKKFKLDSPDPRRRLVGLERPL